MAARGREGTGKQKGHAMKMLLIAALSASLMTLTAPAMAAPPELPGYERLEIPAAHRGAPLAGSIWYPASRATYRSLIGDNPVFEGTPALVGAAAPDAPLPLVVVSHGSGGNMDGLGWLGAGLAARGAMMLAVNHPGSTSGDSSPRRSIRLDQRAADLRAALDAALTDPVFGPAIDRTRISVLGFSLGGATALPLAGARIDPPTYSRWCADSPSAPDCMFFAKGGVDLDNPPAEIGQDMTDPRLSAAIAVDPGFTWAMTPASLAQIRMPVLAISLGTPPAAVDPVASGLIDALPDARHITLPDTDHYGFLSLCKPGAPALLITVGEDPICDIPPGPGRAATHDQALAAISDFLEL